MENGTEKICGFGLLLEMSRNRDVDGWDGRRWRRCPGGITLFAPLADFANF